MSPNSTLLSGLRAACFECPFTWAVCFLFSRLTVVHDLVDMAFPVFWLVVKLCLMQRLLMTGGWSWVMGCPPAEFQWASGFVLAH